MQMKNESFAQTSAIVPIITTSHGQNSGSTTVIYVPKLKLEVILALPLLEKSPRKDDPVLEDLKNRRHSTSSLWKIIFKSQLIT